MCSRVSLPRGGPSRKRAGTERHQRVEGVAALKLFAIDSGRFWTGIKLILSQRAITGEIRSSYTSSDRNRSIANTYILGAGAPASCPLG